MTLQNADEVRSHWWPREGWRPGRLVYTWHLTFEHAPQLHRLAERYQQALATINGHNPVPAQWLHLTVQGIGFADEVPDERLEEITQAVAVRLGKLAPAELTFARPVILNEAVVLAPTPAEPLHEIWGEIRNGIAEVTGEAPTAAEQVKGFRPHVSLTYINTPGPAQPYVTALSGVEAEPVKVEVDRVALIVQNRVLEPEWVYRWKTQTVSPLGANRGI
ncbi:2'-5' RNA ligase family protein [Nonomuraea wenchangensis]|uniref:2'-5' RNA ligase n=1 Tax=Nonomuraea wenchangensis TaxID=568860 RepID=A0A1I0LT48_9ACTN|nr:2'-5' RNA ligase family protein [Nonomuraea wenchangensis]SEU46082.1 2'-5' RNA ligase [Nonomuraea wenchangensis]